MVWIVPEAIDSDKYLQNLTIPVDAEKQHLRTLFDRIISIIQ